MNEDKNNVLDYAGPSWRPKSKPVSGWAAASLLLPEVAMLLVFFFEPLQINSVSLDNEFSRSVTIGLKVTIHILPPIIGIAAGIKGIACVRRSNELRGIGVSATGIAINLFWIVFALLALRGFYHAY